MMAMIISVTFDFWGLWSFHSRGRAVSTLAFQRILAEFEASYVDVGQQVLLTRLGRILWMIEEATLLMGKLLTVLSFFKAKQHFMPL